MSGESRERTLLSDASDGLKGVLQRIADFFDILDLSFLVSGGACFSAVLYLLHVGGASFSWPNDAFERFAVAVFASYVLGLICFAVGRQIRRVIASFARSKLQDRMTSVVAAHGLADDSICHPYVERMKDAGEHTFSGEAQAYRLYVRVWSEVRDRVAIQDSMRLLRRYWVMTATYDGVATALLFWSAVLAISAPASTVLEGWRWFALNPWIACPALLLAAGACLTEASKYWENQVEELFASYATLRSRSEDRRGDRVSKEPES